MESLGQGRPNGMERQVSDVMNAQKSEVLFNLDGVDVWGVVTLRQGMPEVQPIGSCFKSIPTKSHGRKSNGLKMGNM